MTLNVADLRNRIAGLFPDVEQVDDSVLRFTRKAGDQPFAIYYVDVAPTLPSTAEALNNYQDRVIGKHYFDGRKSLQWSNYLYFVVSEDRSRSEDVQKAKTLIERDRTYARKCIITESEIDTAFVVPIIRPAVSTPHASILSVWTQKLTDAGLDRAVLSDQAMPGRLSMIEAPSTPSKSRSATAPQRIKGDSQPFLQSLKLAKYRDYPLTREFGFGTVNLFVGVNGSGKTSLLEAIELWYCGRNKRNPDADDSYSIAATFANGKDESASDDRKAQFFRDRNFSWYGQAEGRTNNLYQSFAQFNFLDTDAAVRLAESTGSLEDDLSKLLVGPQASKVWKDIEKVSDAVAGRLRELEPLDAQAAKELAALETQLKATSGIEQESDSLWTRLEAIVRQLGWTLLTEDKTKAVSTLISQSSQIASLIQQATAIDGIAAPATLKGLDDYCVNAKRLVETVEADCLRLRTMQGKVQNATRESKRLGDIESLLIEAREIVATGILERAEQLRLGQQTIQDAQNALGLFDEGTISVLEKTDQSQSLGDFIRNSALVARQAREALELASKEQAEFTGLRNRAVGLAQQLREIAAEILKDQAKPDECPLCHTDFGDGELRPRMQSGVDAQIESRAQALLSKVRNAESDVSNADSAEHVVNWLSSFAERMTIPESVSIQDVLKRIESTRSDLSGALRQAELLQAELRSFESQGKSLSRIDEIKQSLRALELKLDTWTAPALEKLTNDSASERKKHLDAMADLRKESEALKTSIELALGLSESAATDVESTLSKRKESLSVAEGIKAKFTPILTEYPWPSDKALSELAVENESVRSTASDFQAALARERSAETSRATAVNRKAELTKQRSESAPRIERLKKAKKVLDELIRDHSLNGAMEAALRTNRAGIEAIFSRIHTPCEFSGLGKQITALVRKNNPQEAALSQISTGQRAAFALSIFLAQNAQLVSAPPVILIDDPIAHIDDLNSLAFLDYLREIAVSGTRQIFFATASEKLASLFERKFDFLGPEKFRRYDFRR
jgi:exonuclease SbcC